MNSFRVDQLSLFGPLGNFRKLTWLDKVLSVVCLHVIVNIILYHPSSPCLSHTSMWPVWSPPTGLSPSRWCIWTRCFYPMKMLVFQLLCSSLGRAILMITIYTYISVEQPHCIHIYISALPIMYLSMTWLVKYCCISVLHDGQSIITSYW